MQVGMADSLHQFVMRHDVKGLGQINAEEAGAARRLPLIEAIRHPVCQGEQGGDRRVL